VPYPQSLQAHHLYRYHYLQYSYFCPISLPTRLRGLRTPIFLPLKPISLSQPASAWRSTPLNLSIIFLHDVVRTDSRPRWLCLGCCDCLKCVCCCVLTMEQNRADTSVAIRIPRLDNRISNVVLMARRSSTAMTAVSSTTMLSLDLVLGK
jgi:hypothetical protein